MKDTVPLLCCEGFSVIVMCRRVQCFVMLLSYFGGYIFIFMLQRYSVIVILRKIHCSLPLCDDGYSFTYLFMRVQCFVMLLRVYTISKLK